MRALIRRFLWIGVAIVAGALASLCLGAWGFLAGDQIVSHIHPVLTVQEWSERGSSTAELLSRAGLAEPYGQLIWAGLILAGGILCIAVILDAQIRRGARFWAALFALSVAIPLSISNYWPQSQFVLQTTQIGLDVVIILSAAISLISIKGLNPNCLVSRWCRFVAACLLIISGILLPILSAITIAF